MDVVVWVYDFCGDTKTQSYILQVDIKLSILITIFW